MRHSYLASLLFGRPLLIEPGKLNVILHVVSDRLEITPPQVPREALEARKQPPSQVPEGSAIAVIDVFGSMVHRARGMEADSGLTSYESIGNALMMAAKDRHVGGILLHIDSPGGEVNGAFPLAHMIGEIAREKPVWASVDESAWSAGYLLASQANRILLSRNASVGSVGVVLLHVDQSGKDEKEGLKWTVISRGANKTHFNPHQPLSEGAVKWADNLLDHEYGMFVDAVAMGRKLDPATVRGTEAGIIAGQQAVAQGFADAHLDYRDAVGEMAAYIRPKTTLGGQKTMSIEATVPVSPLPASSTAAPAATQPTITVAQMPQLVTAPPNEAMQIAELCLMCGKRELAATFITQGKTYAEVRKYFLDAQADVDEGSETFSAIEPQRNAKQPERKPEHTLAQRMKMRLEGRRA